jgi:hypothetical protein
MQGFWQKGVPNMFITPFLDPRKWLIINCVVDVAQTSLLGLHI